MVYRRRSRYPRPSKADSGIILPEFILHAALADLPRKLGTGTYLQGLSEEPVISVLGGLTQEMIDGCFKNLQDRPPRLALQFPRDPEQLPAITVVAEDMLLEGPIIGNVGSKVNDEVETVTTDTVLTPSGGAVGGETVFQLPARDVIASSVDLVITRGTDDIPLYYGYGEYTVTAATGEITLATGLVAGDVLTCSRFIWLGLPGGETFSNIMRFNHVVFIDTDSSLITSFLTGLVWHTLVLQEDVILASGLDSLTYHRRSYSNWDLTHQPLGVRSELVVSGLADWVAFRRGTIVRTVSVDEDSTDGTESILQLTADVVVWDGTEDDRDC